jgi:hypothetical protein
MKRNIALCIFSIGSSCICSQAFAYTNPHSASNFDYLWDQLTVERPYLFRGQRLQSSGCGFHVDMQSDGNLVVYGGTNNNTAYWSSGTAGSGGLYVIMRNDGNFVMYDSSGGAVWYTGTQGTGTDRVIMQHDGNFVAYNYYGSTWSTHTNGRAPWWTPYCVQASESTYIHTDHMVNGDAYLAPQPFPANATDCAYQCVQDRSCVAFSWYSPGHGGGVGDRACFLRHGITSEYYETLVTSGYIRGRKSPGQ